MCIVYTLVERIVRMLISIIVTMMLVCHLGVSVPMRLLRIIAVVAVVVIVHIGVHICLIVVQIDRTRLCIVTWPMTVIVW